MPWVVTWASLFVLLQVANQLVQGSLGHLFHKDLSQLSPLYQATILTLHNLAMELGA